MSIVSQSFSKQQLKIEGEISFDTAIALEKFLSATAARAMETNNDAENDMCEAVADLCGLTLEIEGNSGDGQA